MAKLEVGTPERKALNLKVQAALVASVDAAPASIAGVITGICVKGDRLFIDADGSVFNCFLSDPQKSTVAGLTFRKRGPVKVNARTAKNAAKEAEAAKA